MIRDDKRIAMACFIARTAVSCLGIGDFTYFKLVSDKGVEGELRPIIDERS
jgi:hypothetical protein